MTAVSAGMLMTAPTRWRARASLQRTPPWPAARRRFARASRAGENPGEHESSEARSRSPLPGPARGTPPAGLDSLPLDGKTPPFAEPTQACHDLVVLDLFGRTAVFADHELTLMRALGVAARDKRI